MSFVSAPFGSPCPNVQAGRRAQSVKKSSRLCSKDWTCRCVPSIGPRPAGCDSVEHHRPDMGGVALRVERADDGAVAVTDVAELGVTERPPERFQVASGACRAEVGEQPACLADRSVCASRWALASSAATSAGVSGVGSRSGASNSRVVVQRTGTEPPLPRVSHDTMSNRPFRPFGKRFVSWPMSRRNLTPESAGPPGLNSSEPMRAPDPVFFRRATASSICDPFGWSQSRGTVSRAHSSPSPQLFHAVSFFPSLSLLRCASCPSCRVTSGARSRRSSGRIVPPRRR